MNKISQLISLLGGTGFVAEKLKIQPSAILIGKSSIKYQVASVKLF